MMLLNLVGLTRQRDQGGSRCIITLEQVDDAPNERLFETDFHSRSYFIVDIIINRSYAKIYRMYYQNIHRNKGVKERIDNHFVYCHDECIDIRL